jgi:hypothetical protein
MQTRPSAVLCFRWLPGVAIASTLGLAACSSVQEKHLNRWEGQPLAALERHPIFGSLPAIRTVTPDGTLIWRYVQGFDPLKCSEGNRVVSSDINFKSYERFSICMDKKSACNHIFYAKDKLVKNYALVATGGARCTSGSKWNPDHRGAT